MNSMLPGLPRAWRGPEANFFRVPYFKKISGEIFFRQQPPPPSTTLFSERVCRNCFPLLFSIFHTKFRYFAQKNPISCPLCRNISPKKMTGAQQKISRGPQNLGAPRTDIFSVYTILHTHFACACSSQSLCIPHY